LYRCLRSHHEDAGGGEDTTPRIPELDARWQRMVKFVDVLLCSWGGGLQQEVRRAPQLVRIEPLQVLNN